MSKLQTTNLRDGWRIARVGEILKVRNGYAFKSTDYRDEGVPLIRQSNLGDDLVDVSDAKRVDPRFLKELPGFMVENDDLLIGMSGSLGKIARYQNSEPALQNQRTGLLMVKPDNDRKFAKLVLKYVEPQIIAEGKGIAVQNVSAKEIEDCVFPLPPLDDQRRIVAEIEKQFTRLEAGVAALRRVQANLKRYRAAVLKAACEGRLVPTEAELARAEGRPFESGQQLLARLLTARRQNWLGRGKYKEPDAPNTANFQLLPEDWTWASVEQIGRIETGSTPPKAETANYGDGVPLVKPGELLDHPVGEAADNLTRQGAAVATTAPAESVLVSCIGNLGKTALTVREVAFNQQINAIIPTLTRTARWTFYAVQQRAFRQQLESVASATTISIVNKSKFSALIIPLPPLAEQTRIVAEVERRLSVVAELEAVVTTNLQRATRLRQSILQQAFTGGLI